MKLTGRAGPQVDLGMISAVTGERSLETRTEGGEVRDRVAAPLTGWNVLRLRRRFGGGGYVGFLGTAVNRWERPARYPTAAAEPLCPTGDNVAPGARCLHDSYVGALDGRWRSPAGDYVATGQAALSLIHGGPPRTFPDGTVIRSGDIDCEFRVSLDKEGGAHWLASLFTSSTGRRFDRNDLGFMRRQNDWWMGAWGAYRTTEPFWQSLESSVGIDTFQGMNLDGLLLERAAVLELRTKLKSFWSLGLSVRGHSTRYDDREVGDGRALELPALVGGTLSVESDPRRPVQGSLEASADVRRAGGAGALDAKILVRVLPQLDLELLPNVTWTTGETRYAGNAASGAPVFGRLRAASVGSTLRATYTFTPRLTLQTYLQLFLARKEFGAYWALAPGASGDDSRTVHLRDLVAGAPPAEDPSFSEGIVNANVVLRWEYRLGSTLFLVYTRAQRALPGEGMYLPRRLDLGAIRRGPAADTVLLKLSRFWG